MKTSTSLILTGMWVGLAVAFSAMIIYPNFGPEKTMQFITVFSLEKLLSMDNLLVMSMIFGYFGIPKEKQSSALNWGLFGAVFFRSTIILSGGYIVNSLSWVLYIFAAFLIYAGYGMLSEDDGNYNPEESNVVNFVKRHFGRFGVFIACIVAIEISDILFAVDSIPASFGVSQDTFVILSANLFAVLGLRSLYHAVENGMSALSGIEKYVGAILMLVGANVLLEHFFKVPEGFLMGLVFSILCFGIYKCKTTKKEGEYHGRTV